MEIIHSYMPAIIIILKNEDMIEKLVKLGANINKENKYGITPSH